MELIRGRHNLNSRHRGCVVTIGNFDGVHRGHQAVIEQLNGLAATAAGQRRLPSLLITFEPHPREFFLAHDPPARLSRLRDKLSVLAATALDRVLCLRFDADLAGLAAEDFIDQLLVEQLGVQTLVIGDDFRFGRGGSGDIALLREAGQKHGFAVINCATYSHRGRRVSSSWVREALTDGNLALAAELLGRPYAISGRVVYGDRLGHTLGFPTANLGLHHRRLPLSGVFATRVKGLSPAPLTGVTNVGVRPTVNGMEPRLETYIFDFSETIYGRVCEVEFLHKIRSEQRFDSLDALKAQIGRDSDQARAYFANTDTDGLTAC